MGTEALSTNATRVWSVLREQAATDEKHALTDTRLAELTHLPRREIIDAAGELLGAGVLVLAGSSGRWIGTPAQARRYARVLRRRALRIFVRRRDLLRAERSARRQQPRDDTGQLSLAFQPPPRPRRPPCEAPSRQCSTMPQSQIPNAPCGNVRTEALT